jgi:hypothetical protein
MNGRLRRCRCACFAKREELVIDSATGPREALSGAHVRVQYAPLRCSLRLASGRFLNTLDSVDTESDS